MYKAQQLKSFKQRLLFKATKEEKHTPRQEKQAEGEGRRPPHHSIT
jgi:hypothetical protein